MVKTGQARCRLSASRPRPWSSGFVHRARQDHLGLLRRACTYRPIATRTRASTRSAGTRCSGTMFPRGLHRRGVCGPPARTTLQLPCSFCKHRGPAIRVTFRLWRKSSSTWRCTCAVFALASSPAALRLFHVHHRTASHSHLMQGIEGERSSATPSSGRFRIASSSSASRASGPDAFISFFFILTNCFNNIMLCFFFFTHICYYI